VGEGKRRNFLKWSKGRGERRAFPMILLKKEEKSQSNWSSETQGGISKKDGGDLSKLPPSPCLVNISGRKETPHPPAFARWGKEGERNTSKASERRKKRR